MSGNASRIQMPKLRVSGLNTHYGPAHILFDVALDVGASQSASHDGGEVVALLGRNGAGKSTTLRAIIGLVPQRSGTVILDGEDISALPTYEIARRGVGYVPEDRRIFTELTVEENLEVGRQPPRKGVAREGMARWTPERIYTLFPNLGELRKRQGGRMSGGEQQMLSIARTLMGNPSLVLLDEPSEGLAPRIVEQMAGAILAMKKQGLNVLIPEQNLHFARLISDRVYIIEKGRIRFSGTLAELEAQPEVRDAYLAV